VARAWILVVLETDSMDPRTLVRAASDCASELCSDISDRAVQRFYTIWSPGNRHRVRTGARDLRI